MAKFYGPVGYGITSEDSPGIWVEHIEEKLYFGDVLINIRQWSSGEGQNDDLNITNKISIIADPFANRHIGAIRYVEYLGVRWKVRSADLAWPRIILSLGGVYHEQSRRTSEETGGDSGDQESVLPTASGFPT